MIFIEPTQNYIDRKTLMRKEAGLTTRYSEPDQELKSPQELLCDWDHFIFGFLRAQPNQTARMTSVANALANSARSSRTVRERVKVQIFKSIGKLIEMGRLVRVQRKFVRERRFKAEPRHNRLKSAQNSTIKPAHAFFLCRLQGLALPVFIEIVPMCRIRATVKPKKKLGFGHLLCASGLFFRLLQSEKSIKKKEVSNATPAQASEMGLRLNDQTGTRN
jgi:hypothetical protein